MATSSLSHGEVKSISDALECSPSQSQPTSPLYKGSDRNPTVQHKKTGGKSAAAGTPEAGFKASRKMAVK